MENNPEASFFYCLVVSPVTSAQYACSSIIVAGNYLALEGGEVHQVPIKYWYWELLGIRVMRSKPLTG